MKKRALALALAAAMSLGTITSVTADDYENLDTTQTATGSVTGTVNGYKEPETGTYLVTVTIPSLSVTYNMGTLGTWDTASMKYDGVTGDGWDGGEDPTATVTVVNKSNKPIKLNCKYAQDPTYGTEITGAFDKADETLESAVNKENPLQEGTEQTAEFKLTISGTPTKEIKDQTVGTVTLTVDKAPAE